MRAHTQLLSDNHFYQVYEHTQCRRRADPVRPIRLIVALWGRPSPDYHEAPAGRSERESSVLARLANSGRRSVSSVDAIIVAPGFKTGPDRSVTTREWAEEPLTKFGPPLRSRIAHRRLRLVPPEVRYQRESLVGRGEEELCSATLWSARSSGDGQSESHRSHRKAGADRRARPIGRTGSIEVRELRRGTHDAR